MIVCLLLFSVLTTRLIVMKFSLHVVRSTETDIEYFSCRKITEPVGTEQQFLVPHKSRTHIVCCIEK